MYLYNCVFIITAFVTIFSAESIPNHAVSPPQSFVGRDLRSYYGYNLMHASTTFRPYDEYYTKKRRNKNNPTNSYQVVNYHNIQYAPLPLNSKEHYSNRRPAPQEEKAVEISTETNAYGSNYEIDSQRDKQRYLVPQLHSTESSDIAHRKYIPGYNIEMQAINNKLAQNGFYATNPNLLVKNKQVNVNLLQPQVTYKNQGIPQNIAKTKPPFSMLHYEYPDNIKTYDVNIATRDENNDERPFFYVKASKVQLNLARARKIARAYRKASVNFNSSFRRFPSYPQEFFSDQKFLHPSKTETDYIKNSNTRMIPRTD